jgi:hypothetical protein
LSEFEVRTDAERSVESTVLEGSKQVASVPEE